ncbi:hypothetical protein BDN72DRAFT_836248 [Pluteus cervinus]|uniref:Uncharacterized protein n=1 Tax=Pluteus cervinus TaxID=181527 RepID=A0ACD3B494_9AGAR|nr:hypothetical protein BDN72DRAFT_836248 [Pluteus cervinus]
MFSTIVQPSIVSLFSSTNTDPLALFEVHTDPSLPADSFVHLLHDRSSQPPLPPPAIPILPPPLFGNEDDGETGPANSGSLHQTVLHIQSPTLRTTYIECPRDSQSLKQTAPGGQFGSLDLKHPWVHIQVRDMGREWSFEIGVVDQAGRSGIIRLSTFQKQPHLKLSQRPGSLPLLHLPLSFPAQSTHRLTAWSTIAINLPSLLPYFSSLQPTAHEHNPHEANLSNPVPLPGGIYSHVSYIRVYATCRLKRVWFSNFGPNHLSHEIPWEFKLYGASG